MCFATILLNYISFHDQTNQLPCPGVSQFDYIEYVFETEVISWKRDGCKSIGTFTAFQEEKKRPKKF